MTEYEYKVTSKAIDTDADAEIAWRMGEAAFLATRRAGARFPHQIEIRCPSCGGVSYLVEGDNYFVMCSACKMRGPGHICREIAIGTFKQITFK